jgi:hypothetical protein
MRMSVFLRCTVSTARLVPIVLESMKDGTSSTSLEERCEVDRVLRKAVVVMAMLIVDNVKKRTKLLAGTCALPGQELCRCRWAWGKDGSISA